MLVAMPRRIALFTGSAFESALAHAVISFSAFAGSAAGSRALTKLDSDSGDEEDSAAAITSAGFSAAAAIRALRVQSSCAAAKSWRSLSAFAPCLAAS